MPTKWDVYGNFGQAVQVAQTLERVLAYYIEVFELHGKGTIDKAVRDDIFSKLERLTLGQLKQRFQHFLPNADQKLIEMLQDALRRRNDLIHRFFITYEKYVKTPEHYPKLIAKLQDDAHSLDTVCMFFVRVMQKTKRDVAKHFPEGL